MIHKNLQYTKTFLSEACKFNCTEPEAELESAAYAACSFTINNKAVRYRVAKVTPTKAGQFVTLWKRIATGTIAPFDLSDDIDLVIISVSEEEHSGLFVFPRAVLIEKEILSTNTKEGKRGFRVYPPWSETINKQAMRTQQWQLKYFLKFLVENKEDVAKAKALFE